jgi:hypothetical protein
VPRRADRNFRLRKSATAVIAVVSVGTLFGIVACSGNTRADHEPSAAPRTVVTVDTSRPGTALPTDFLGLSFEASVLSSGLFDPARSDLASLMRDLGSGRLRFGGNSVDRVAAWAGAPAAPLPPWAHSAVMPVDFARLGALTAATGWKVDLGLTLGHPDPAAAAQETAAAARLIGNGLGTVQIGNEPDLLGSVRPGYGEAAYRADVEAYRAAIARAAPDVKLSGPDTAGPAQPYASDERAGLAFVTQHHYPLTRCGGVQPTIDELLSASVREAEDRMAAAVVAAGRGLGLPVRLDETNSASCGGQDGVSNTVASALWMVEYLITVAQRGVAGVGVQGGLAACRGYTPLCVPGATGAAPGTAPGIDPIADASLGAADARSGRLAAQPDFYGLLLVHELEGGRWLPVASARPTGAWEAAARMPGGAVRVVVLNPSESGADITLHLLRSGGRASVQWLSGPSLAATSGVTLGGSSVASDGTWHPRADIPVPASRDGFQLRVPAATAGLLTVTDSSPPKRHAVSPGSPHDTSRNSGAVLEGLHPAPVGEALPGYVMAPPPMAATKPSRFSTVTVRAECPRRRRVEGTLSAKCTQTPAR